MRSERLPIGRSAVRIGLRVGPDGDFERLHRSAGFCLAVEQMQIVLRGDLVGEAAADHPLRVRHQDEVFYIRYAANETDAIDGRTITFWYGFHGISFECLLVQVSGSPCAREFNIRGRL